MKRMLVGSLLLASRLAFGDDYDCKPTVKYDCTATACTRDPSNGFRTAEAFAFASKTNTLTACLWTSCWEGKATQLQRAPLSLTGGLPSQNPGYGTIVVSLTINDDKSFVATYGQDGRSITLDMGTCTVKPGAGPPT